MTRLWQIKEISFNPPIRLEAQQLRMDQVVRLEVVDNGAMFTNRGIHYPRPFTAVFEALVTGDTSLEPLCMIYPESGKDNFSLQLVTRSEDGIGLPTSVDLSVQPGNRVHLNLLPNQEISLACRWTSIIDDEVVKAFDIEAAEKWADYCLTHNRARIVRI